MKRLITNLINNPSWRYSNFFSIIQHNLFKYRDYEEILDRVLLFTQFSKIKGDYLEFGVWGGTSFYTAYHLAKKYKLDSMVFYAFDSFKGLPEIKGIDSVGFKQFEKGMFNCGVEKFRKNLEKKRVDLNKVEIIKGWYKETLNKELKNKLKVKKAAVIYIDCDLYESARDVLNFITDYIQDGTVLIFDDWFCFRGNPERGEQKAFSEWLDKNPHFTKSQFYKLGNINSFIINKTRTMI